MYDELMAVAGNDGAKTSWFKFTGKEFVSYGMNKANIFIIIECDEGRNAFLITEDIAQA